MYKLTHFNEETAKTEMLARGWLKDWGTFNAPPTPFFLVEESEYYNKVAVHLPLYVEYRQIEPKFVNGRYITSVHIQWYHDCGYMIVWPNNWTTNASGKIQYIDKPYYYRLGCKHEFDTITIGNCYHEATCRLCGYSYKYDSSG